MILKTSPVITRYPETILSRKDVPYSSALTFNAGIVRHEGRYIMLFRNDYGSYEEQRLDGTNIGLAYSNDGIHWEYDIVMIKSVRARLRSKPTAAGLRYSMLWILTRQEVKTAGKKHGKNAIQSA